LETREASQETARLSWEKKVSEEKVKDKMVGSYPYYGNQGEAFTKWAIRKALPMAISMSGLLSFLVPPPKEKRQSIPAGHFCFHRVSITS